MLKFAGPVTYVDPKDPPMLLIHGLADKLVPASQSKEFEERLRAAHVPVKTLHIPCIDHGLVGPTPKVTSAANKQALDATFTFFERAQAGALVGRGIVRLSRSRLCESANR